MELYGSIKKKKGGFPTLNPTLYVFTTIQTLNLHDLGIYLDNGDWVESGVS